MGLTNISGLLTVIGGITLLTNIIVQVLKQVTWDKLPTNLVALLVSQGLTLCVGGAYVQINGIEITWYLTAGAVTVGFLAAYAAMFGFDKLREMLDGWVKGGADT